jgi:hypothetical protein
VGFLGAAILMFCFLAIVAGAVFIILAPHLAVDRARYDDGGPRSGRSVKHASGVVPCIPAEFHPYAESVLRAAGVRLFEPSRWWRISGFTSRTTHNPGSIVTLWYRPVPQGTGFTIESRIRMPSHMYDWGRNQRLVDHIASGLSPARSG